ncbi:MAG: hypothetical protein M3466_12790 [Gemmatimonadota bacterium]|nr:hypothetical protein [Gemmatimonadota bacterium]
MRHSEQLSLTAPWIGHVHAVELAAISEILDSETRIAALVEQDLLRTCRKNAHTGRPGLTGDQVIRIALVRQMNGWTYAELAFHLADSASYGTFCRVGTLSGTPSKSAVAANLRKLRPETLHEINQLIVLIAARLGLERGRKVRIDSTVVEAWVHAPTDSSLLFDDLFGGELVAIDGSKFRAVKSKRRNFSQASLERLLAGIDARIAEYLGALAFRISSHAAA